jgi:hypothetical protein
MRILRLLILLALPLAGCSTSRDVRLADGWLAHVVSCGGPVLNQGHCLEKAGALCGGRGFRVVDQEGAELPVKLDAMPTGGLPNLPASWSSLISYESRKLLIKCH